MTEAAGAAGPFAYMSLVLATVLFVVALRWSGAVPKVRLAVAETRAAVATMSAPGLSEEEKETAVQRAALRMFGSFGSILLRTAVCIGLPAALLAAGSAAGLHDMDEIVRAATNPWFIAGSTAVVAGGLLLSR